MHTHFDAVIVGGGPAGATAAILLARGGWRVVLVEKSPFPRQKVCGEFISATTWPLLRELGVDAALAPAAGPPVRRVGIFAGDAQLTAPIPSPEGSTLAGGSALGRDVLDAALVARATAAGAQVRQPFRLVRYIRANDNYECVIDDARSGIEHTLAAPIVIAAHGSWESGPLPTQPPRRRPRAADLLAFKARFRGSRLPPDLMPLLSFPGGYGGMVHTDGGLVSLSCCIRRDALAACRADASGARAGDAVIAHIARHCAGVADAVRGATVDSAWLAAGPIRTGLRGFGDDGIFALGNAAAEAHPIVAEGISMAIQSATLLCGRLLAARPSGAARIDAATLDSIRRLYAADWRRNFSNRLRASACYAHIFMRPATARVAVVLLQRFPSLLALGTRWSGKAQPLRSPPMTHTKDNP